MAIQIPIESHSKNYLLTLKLSLSDPAWANSWVRVVQSNNTIFEFYVDAPNFYSFEIETVPSFFENKTGFVSLRLLLSNVSLSLLKKDEQLKSLPDSCIVFSDIKQLCFSKTNKYKILNNVWILQKNHKVNNLNLYEHIRDVILRVSNSNTPFSIIRLGDGEGRLLGFPDYFSIYEIISQCLGYQYGLGVFEKLKFLYGFDGCYKGAVFLNNLLKLSVSSADIIFAPHESFYARSNFKENDLNVYSSMASAVMNVSSIANSNLFFDTFFFYGFYKNGYLDDVLHSRAEIVVISHTDCSHLFSKRFPGLKIKHVKIPPHKSFSNDEGSQFPFLFHSILFEISKISQPSFFLVSAGYLGKYYCHIIKLLGGIALDIGSLFDAMVGIGRTDALRFTELRLSNIESLDM